MLLRPVASALHRPSGLGRHLRKHIEERPNPHAPEDETAQVLIGFHGVIHSGRGKKRLERLRFGELLRDVDQLYVPVPEELRIPAHATRP